VRPAARTVIGLVLVALGVLLVVGAVAVWRWPDRAAAQDKRLLSRSVPAARAWSGMGGPVPMLLGARDDATMRRALVDFRRGRLVDPAGSKDTDEIVSTVSAMVALGAVERDPARSLRERSVAANLQGILLAEESVLAPDGGPRVRRALELFRRAIRYDAGNHAAKTNLELLLLVSGGFNATEESTNGFGGFGKDAGSADAGGGY